MPVIISVCNIKGGVGKTTTSINLAGAFASNGHKTLIIDNDAQSNTTQIFNVVDAENTLYDVYTSTNIGFDDCIYECEPNLYLVPNSIKSATLEMDLNNRIGRERILKNKSETIPKIFDYVIIDNSPFCGITFQNSLVMSDYYISIIDNSSSALQGLNMIQNVVNELNSSVLNEDLTLLGILRNNFDKRTVFTKEFNEVVEEEFSSYLFKTIINNSIRYKEALAMHKTIQTHSLYSAKPYNKLYKEIKKRLKG